MSSTILYSLSDCDIENYLYIIRHYYSIHSHSPLTSHTRALKGGTTNLKVVGGGSMHRKVEGRGVNTVKTLTLVKGGGVHDPPAPMVDPPLPSPHPPPPYITTQFRHTSQPTLPAALQLQVLWRIVKHKELHPVINLTNPMCFTDFSKINGELWLK